MIKRKFTVSIDFVDGVLPAYELDPQGWNGFDVPGFELETAQKIAAHYNSIEDSNYYASFNPEAKSFTFSHPGEEDEEILPEEIETEDGPKTVYNICPGWVWVEEKEVKEFTMIQTSVPTTYAALG